ncbi:hypothetical protein C3L33_22343, partial [Rhododendron williamsianum]
MIDDSALSAVTGVEVHARGNDWYLIASHTTDYENPMLFFNTLAVMVLVIAKFPHMHKVRIFGINGDLCFCLLLERRFEIQKRRSNHSHCWRPNSFTAADLLRHPFPSPSPSASKLSCLTLQTSSLLAAILDHRCCLVRPSCRLPFFLFFVSVFLSDRPLSKFTVLASFSPPPFVLSSHLPSPSFAVTDRHSHISAVLVSLLLSPLTGHQSVFSFVIVSGSLPCFEELPIPLSTSRLDEKNPLAPQMGFNP